MISQNYNDIEHFIQIVTEYMVAQIKTTQNNIILVVVFMGIILIIQNILYLRVIKENKKISKIMFTDTHTGLYNKSKCQSLLEDASRIYDSKHSGFIIFDLNDLKKVNDTLGHCYGDKLIANFANCLKCASNITSPSPFVGRFGGDEFIVFYSVATQKNINDFIKEVTSFVHEYNKIEDDYQISFATGFALASNYDNVDINELLAIADKSMYKDKVSYKDGLDR